MEDINMLLAYSGGFVDEWQQRGYTRMIPAISKVEELFKDRCTYQGIGYRYIVTSVPIHSINVDKVLEDAKLRENHYVSWSPTISSYIEQITYAKPAHYIAISSLIKGISLKSLLYIFIDLLVQTNYIEVNGSVPYFDGLFQNIEDLREFASKETEILAPWGDKISVIDYA